MNKLNVAIFFGGCSSEYGVSLESAYSVIRNLDNRRYEPVLIGITRGGQWYHFSGNIERIKNDTWLNDTDCAPAVLSPSRDDRRLLLINHDQVDSVPIDIAFPVLHGKNGEDGTLQGLIELAGIPLAGCGVLASALCMDKDRAHKLARAAGVRVPRAIVLDQEHETAASRQDIYPTAQQASSPAIRAHQHDSPASQPQHGSPASQPHHDSPASQPHHDSPASQPQHDSPGQLPDTHLTAAEAKTDDAYPMASDFAAKIGYPLYVKPVKAGSSYGVTKVQRPDELEEAIRLAFCYDDQVIIEENIEGFEVGCAVLGNDALMVGEVDEIELSGGFFDFTEKYTLKTSAIHVPARISREKSDEIRETAKVIYKALGCRVFARVDMFLTPDGQIVFNEINTIPGFTEHSRYPGMMKAAGHSFPEIIDRILELAVEQ